LLLLQYLVHLTIRFLLIFFFFQAEDGIRDRNVTGVQTCALPIWTGRGLLPPSPLFPAQGDLSIFPVPEWMQPADRRRDPSCHYVGPAADLESRAEEADPELEAFLDTEEAVVLLSLGTLHAVGESFLRSCLEAFGRFPARVLISGGPGADPAALGPLPSHILVRRHVPQLAVLRRADVFVTHGGMNSVLESLHFGVPMVVLP